MEIKLKTDDSGKGRAVTIVLAVILVLVTAAWWVFVPAYASDVLLGQTVSTIGISLSAVLGIMTVASIFAFTKINDCRKSMARAKSEYISKLIGGKQGPPLVVQLRNEIREAIENSNSVEERTEWLDKLYNVSVLCGVIEGGDEASLKEARDVMIKVGYTDRYYLNNFEDFVLAATVDEMTFFQFIEEMVGSHIYNQFDVGAKLVGSLKEDFFLKDRVYDSLWTIRGGAETTGPFFKSAIVTAVVTIILSFFVVPMTSETVLASAAIGNMGLQGLLTGIVVTLGVYSFFCIGRYILKVIGGRY
jgi:hypothetical protein